MRFAPVTARVVGRRPAVAPAGRVESLSVFAGGVVRFFNSFLFMANPEVREMAVSHVFLT
jgi:hypothetical protein